MLDPLAAIAASLAGALPAQGAEVPFTEHVISTDRAAIAVHLATQAQGQFDIEIKITASDAAEGDNFGFSVAIAADTAIVGTRWNDDAGINSGSAYIFARSQGGPDNWGEVLKLTASDAAAFDSFGQSVAIAGDTAIVGADRDSDGGSESGSAYIFERNQGGVDNWGEVIKLTASDAAPVDLFGISVAISGDTAIVGADHNDDAGDFSGSTYIFQRNQGGANNWGEVLKLTASDAALNDLFGISVSISGDIAVVGAVQNDDVGGSNSGSAYIFARNQGGTDNWGQLLNLTASDAAAGDRFGISVAISGDTVIVGAFRDKNDSGIMHGSAYIFARNQGGADNWGEVIKVIASDPAHLDGFGVRVAISGDTAIVGAYENDDDGSDSGSAYIFARNQGGADNWGQVVKLTASDAATEDFFGNRVGISGDTPIAGAFHNDDDGSNSGSAYIFVSEAPPPPIPTVSEWGLMVMALVVLTAGTLIYARRRRFIRLSVENE